LHAAFSELSRFFGALWQGFVAGLDAASPVASFAYSATPILVIAVLVSIYTWIRRWRRADPSIRKPSRISKTPGGLKGTIERLRDIDRALVWWVSWVVGSHWHRSWLRKVHIPLFFLIMAIGGTVAPWPFCILVLIAGLFGVLIVFRQWSNKETDDEYGAKCHDKKLAISGKLTIEVVIACASVFILAPIAFAQIRLSNNGFVVDPPVHPYSFVLFTAIEMLRIGPIIRYDDIFSPFDPNVRVDTGVAKAALLTFRFSIDLIIIAVVKRSLDILQRVAAGLDLRPFEEDLREGSDADRIAAIRKLEEFSKLRRAKAADLILDIIKHPRGDGPPDALDVLKHEQRAYIPNHIAFPDDVRLAASKAIIRIGDWLKDMSYLYRARGELEEIERRCEEDEDKLKWADIKKSLGDVNLAIGKPEAVFDRLRKAGRYYKKALSVYKTRDKMELELAQTRNSYEESVRLLDGRGDTAYGTNVLKELARANREVETNGDAPELAAA
jgi:hypothetical protein